MDIFPSSIVKNYFPSYGYAKNFFLGARSSEIEELKNRVKALEDADQQKTKEIAEINKSLSQFSTAIMREFIDTVKSFLGRK